MDELLPSSLDEVLTVDARVWSDEWMQAHACFVSSLEAVPRSLAADLAFRLTASLFSHGNDLVACRPTVEFVRDCTTICTPLYRPSPGQVRTLYFPTRFGDVPQFCGLLAFSGFWALVNRYQRPVAWLSFPFDLLGEEAHGRLERLVVEMERIRRRFGVFDEGAPVALRVDRSSQAEAMFHLGKERPADWQPKADDDFAMEHGLPLVCVPSRSVTQLKVSRVPWASPGNAY